MRLGVAVVARGDLPEDHRKAKGKLRETIYGFGALLFGSSLQAEAFAARFRKWRQQPLHPS